MNTIEELRRDMDAAYSNPAPLGDGGTTEAEFLDLLDRAMPLLEAFDQLIEAAQNVARMAQPVSFNDQKWLDRVAEISERHAFNKKPTV